ncbi:hypothetical protein [Blastococcus sp. TF02A-26]|uniref:hypothetical protein n=1 Tax=Blastococcus sp. TF02A-26 TaxID=2250577 RepID=UPI000DEAABF0|nr:hypothetical protein [Blastococcus sp. TF02A-26]RBY82664.1 hypothetical protein DQ240_18375 [Blastococcus sp. TF02A-26]
MNFELIFGLGAPLATVLLIARWLINHTGPVRPKAASACGCGHDFAFHDLANGTCGGLDVRTRPGYYSLTESVGCGCKQFTGTVR